MKKKLLLIIALLAGNTCLAHTLFLLGSSGILDELVWDIMFLVLVLPFIISPLLAILSYHRKRKALKISAWICTTLTLLYGFGIHLLQLRNLPIGILTFCFIVLITRELKNSTAGITPARAVIIGGLYLTAFQLIIFSLPTDLYMHAMTIPCYAALFFFHAWLLRRVQQSSHPARAHAKGMLQVLLTSIKIGAISLALLCLFFLTRYIVIIH